MKMKGSKWAVVIVVVLVVGVLAVKYVRTPAPSSQPPAIAQAPQVSAEAEPAPVDVETSSPAVSGSPAARTETPAGRTRAPTAASGEAPGEASEPAGSATARPTKPAGEKPEGPLPGSKLGECLKNGRPTMADFGLGTCKWCKLMEPILKQATEDYWGKANILFVALDTYPDLARQYRIATMPTQIFFDASGEQVGSHMGFLDRAGIDERLGALGARPGAKQ